MDVALIVGAMRLSEIITIYFAAAAPVGVAYFLRRQTLTGRAHALALAAGASLVWPVTCVSMLLGRNRSAEAVPDAKKSGPITQHERKIERAQGALRAALHLIEDISEEMLGGERETLKQALFVVRESVERYVGLALAAAEVRIDGAPSARETELFRIAGRTGDDLLLAGRCVHRRNVAQLIAHRDRARTELLHALARVRETLDVAHLSSARANLPAARRLSEAILRFYGRAIELLSLLDDRRAVMSVARLLDAECARLGRVRLEKENEQHMHTVNSPSTRRRA